ncbi:hypothetical protein FPOA_06355 [Fusarium poae]|uniref:Uncharacterized protein n=1 Tax=Fusarium poae TaxID=36050 RepID=A0A1B8AZ92_FUSPO|nr:hypothetical protein FPOA_06355 [Fusarium poae]
MFSPCAKIKEIMVAGHPVLSHLGYCTDDDDPTYVEGDTSRNTKAKDDCRIRDNYRYDLDDFVPHAQQHANDNRTHYFYALDGLAFATKIVRDGGTYLRFEAVLKQAGHFLQHANEDRIKLDKRVIAQHLQCHSASHAVAGADRTTPVARFLLRNPDRQDRITPDISPCYSCLSSQQLRWRTRVDGSADAAMPVDQTESPTSSTGKGNSPAEGPTAEFETVQPSYQTPR